MTAVRKQASLAPQTVQKIARDGLEKINKRPRKARRVYATQVKISHWSDGVDPRVVKIVKSLNPHLSQIQVISPTEVIINNYQGK